MCDSVLHAANIRNIVYARDFLPGKLDFGLLVGHGLIAEIADRKKKQNVCDE
jgi:hypothetical protein